MKSRSYEMLNETFSQLTEKITAMLNGRARQARYHAFKYIALGECEHCRVIAFSKMKQECPEKFEKDLDVKILSRSL